MRDEPRSGCPINAALEALGDAWSLIVLRDVMFGDRRTFRALLTGSEEGIASNVLSSRLKSLTAGGLLSHEPAVRGARGRYSLTEAGIATLPVLVALGGWGLAHRDGTPRLRIRAQVLAEGGPGLTDELMDELRETHLGTPRPHPDRPSVAVRLQEAYPEPARGGTGDSPRREPAGGAAVSR